MSGVVKKIGKAFKSIVKVVKKIALPALAIGAVVLTGGAALGVLPALGGAGGLLASIGIKGALSTILVSAAKAATFGAIGAALTGGNIIKGATKGFVVGGVLGGVSALAGAGQAAAGAAGQTADAAANTASSASNAASALPPVADGASFTEAFAPIANGGTATGAGLGTVGQVAASAPVVASAAPVASAAVPASTGGGLGSFFGNMHPMVQSQLISGIGQGLVGNADAKDARKERERIEANYGDTSGLFFLDGQPGGNLPDAGAYFTPRVYGRSRLAYDPQRGRVVAGG